MRWIIVVAGVLLASGAVAVVIGYFTPPTRITARSALLPAEPQRVWAAITTVEAYPRWRRHLRGVAMLPAVDGRPAWQERTWHGVIVNQIDERTPPRRLVIRLADRVLSYRGTWTFELAPEATGTRLTITEHGEIERPACRGLARYVFGYGDGLAGYLAALRGRLAGEARFPMDHRPQDA